jgi:hypothetical protein
MRVFHLVMSFLASSSGLRLGAMEDTDAYKTLEENPRKIGFDNATNRSGQKQSWRWRITMDDGSTVILELLADRSEMVGGKVEPLPTEGNISALNVPHSSMVFDLHDSTDVTAELLDGEGITTETIRYANIVSFVCLKALAFEDRAERKDAHELVYCIENAPGGVDAAAASFREQMEGKHRAVLLQCVGILSKHFASEEKTEGYLKDGPTMVANFELEDSGTCENRVLRRRMVSDTMELFLNSLGSARANPSASEPSSAHGAQ